MVEIVPLGLHDVYYKKYDEYISITKPTVFAKNIIFGGIYIDIGGTANVLNHKTGEKIEVKFFEKQSDKIQSRLEGKVYDAQGVCKYEISGSFLTKVFLKNLETGE